MSKDLADKLNAQLQNSSPEEVLDYFLHSFEGEVALSTSLGSEDQVLTHMLADLSKTTRIFTLDTGRLFPETYDLIHRTNKRYKINIEVFFPHNTEVEKMVKEHGINLFYESVDNRKRCCHIRKIEPLKRALKGLDAWICGLRREQSPTREEARIVEWDTNNGLLKVNPLIDWSHDRVWDYISANNVPYNPLHDKGYVSIGCLPCTRAISPDEDQRAGRWWWENPDTKECGLHKRQ